MKILVLSKVHFERALRELGHDVKTCSHVSPCDVVPPGHPCSIADVLRLLPRGWEPDAVALGDESLLPLFLGLESLEIPLVWYAIDNHVHDYWHPFYAALFDLIFVAQRDFVESYRRDPERQHVEWLPLYCSPKFDRVQDLSRVHELSFVGSMDPDHSPERVELLKRVAERLPINLHTGSYIKPFNRSRIVLNQCFRNDVNFRTFQAMACGALLLMERVGTGLEDLFEDRRHLLLYDRGNTDQIVDQVLYYRAHESERAEIAARGHEEVMAHHTDRHRAERMIDVLQRAPLGEMIRARLSKRDEIEQEIAKAYEIAEKVFAFSAEDKHARLRAYYQQTAAIYSSVHSRINQKFGTG